MTKFFQIDHACKTKIAQDNVIMNKQKCEVGLASLALSHIFLPSPKQCRGQIFTKCDFLAHLIWKLWAFLIKICPLSVVVNNVVIVSTFFTLCQKFCLYVHVSSNSNHVSTPDFYYMWLFLFTHSPQIVGRSRLMHTTVTHLSMQRWRGMCSLTRMRKGMETPQTNQGFPCGGNRKHQNCVCVGRCI